MTKFNKKLSHHHKSLQEIIMPKMATVKINLNGEDINFLFRADSTGDKGVINQIFINKDYDLQHTQHEKVLFNYIKNFQNDTKFLIIDAGANIGASAIFFANKYKNSVIFTVEPDLFNYKLLSFNTQKLNCFNFHGAISNADGKLALLDPNRSDWGFMTTEIQSEHKDNTVIVDSISPKSILNHPYAEACLPLILKIDIEGGEQTLFKDDIAWLDLFPLVIIELHDWMLPFSGSSRNFLKAISQFDFDLIHKGENIFLFNKRILKNFLDKPS